MTAMLAEIAWLRAHVERVRSLPVDAVAIEGIMAQYERSEPEPRSVQESGTIVSTVGTWRFEQSHRDARTADWSTRVVITPVPENSDE